MLEETKAADLPKDASSGDDTLQDDELSQSTHYSSVVMPPPGEEKVKNQAINIETYNSFSGLNMSQVFEWNIEDYKVKVKKETIPVLHNIVGKAESGTFTAIMGPSGCGKTSLLDCLALRNKTFTGGLRLDGTPLTGSFFLNTGYVHQKELFFHHLSVREHLVFHAVNRLSRIRSREQCEERVETVMAEVDLLKVSDSKIGGGDFYAVKGLSGGERKRLNIATELLADPSILLLDEPTSGLDSVMGELICLLLKTLAVRAPKRIVITSLHTPSSRLFMLFTHVTLLTSKGELAYWGRRDKLLGHLQGLGYVCPPLFNPADFVLELASSKVIQGQAGAESNGGAFLQEDTLDVPKVMNGSILVESEASPKLVEACNRLLMQDFVRIEADNSHKEVVGVKGSKAPLLVSLQMNLWRSWLVQSREVVGIIVGTAMSATLGLVFGILYYDQMPTDNGRNTAGFLFSLLVTLLISSSVGVCLYFPLDYAILMREYYVGANTAPSYFFGRTMSSIPPSLIFLLMGIIPYFMTGLALEAAAFGKFLLVLFIQNFAAQSIGYLASCFSANPVVGLSILPLLVTPMVLFSGMLYERNSVPPGLEWIQDISAMNYSFALLVLYQVEHVAPQVKSFLLAFLQVAPSDISGFLIALTVLAVAYRLLAMIVLVVRVRFISEAQ